MNPRKKNIALSLVLAAFAPLACTETDPVPEAERIDPALCSRDWRVVFSPAENTKTSIDDLQWHGGRLYYTHGRTTIGGTLRSMATTGTADVRTIRDPSPKSFWIEDDHITYVAHDELGTMPLEGAPAEPIPVPQASDPGRQSWALDHDFVYWQERLDPARGDWKVWRKLRDGSGATELGSLPYDDSGIRIFPLASDLFIFSPMTGRSWSLPKTGGELRDVSMLDGWFLGTSADGESLWGHPDMTNGLPGPQQHHTVLRQRLGSPAEPFWPSKPFNAMARNALSDGASGWYVSTWERDLRNDLHLSVWKVTAEGEGTRLACDPLPFTSTESAVLAPDGVYLVVRHTNDDYQIASVPVR
jgi:hypothetical protein